MLRRFHEAKESGQGEVVIWGTGKPQREFLHVDDMASACVHVMALPAAACQQATASQLSHINVGTGIDCSIAELAQTIGDVVGFEGELIFDTSKPDGTPRKLLDVGRLGSMGWRASIGLREGLERTYAWFLENQSTLRGVA
jgi:GDP-L-fucose synthase